MGRSKGSKNKIKVEATVTLDTNTRKRRLDTNIRKRRLDTNTRKRRYHFLTKTLNRIEYLYEKQLLPNFPEFDLTHIKAALDNFILITKSTLTSGIIFLLFIFSPFFVI